MWLAMHIPVVLFIVADRYRLATWPFLALAAPLGVHLLLRALRERSWLRPGWLLILAAGIIPWVPIDGRTAMRPGWCAHVDANLAFMEGELEEAEAAYRSALESDPKNIDAHNWLARTLARRGQTDAAIAHVDRILAEFPDHFPTLRFQAGLLKRSGDLSGAADLLLRAYRVPGKRTHTGTQAVRALRAAGRDAEAEALLREDPKVAARLRRP
jgi:tetratricopeptide (TPR) repeat protein